jgi:hypothetical protein
MTDPYFLGRDVKRQQASRWSNFERWRNVIIAQVFEIDGTIEVPNKPDYVWIHEWGSDYSPAQALRGGTYAADGMPVLVARDPKDPHNWKILGEYTGGLDPSVDNQIFRYSIGPHGDNHQMPAEDNVGPDPVRVWMPAFAPLKCEGNGSDLIVTVWGEIPYWYDGAPEIAAGNLYDLTSHLPGSGNTKYALVYMDMTSGLIEVQDGLETTIGNTPEKPALPANSLPSALVQLTFGQTDITTVDDIIDARNLYGTAQSDYSDIMVDEDGNVMTDGVDVMWE